MLIRFIAAIVAIGLAGSPVRAQSLDGIWKSEGYGAVVEIHGPKVKAFQVTTTTCVPSGTAGREEGRFPSREATFKTDRGGEFFIRTGGTADHKVLHNQGSASDVRIDRIQRLPAVCRHPTPNTPQGNFAVFARTWAENYILFDQDKVNWDEVVAANRARVTDKTTPSELFDIFAGMIGPFHNMHSYIDAPDLKRKFHTFRPGTDRATKGAHGREFLTKVMPGLLAVTNTAYLKAPLRKFCNDRVQYGHVDETTGYLRIIAFAEYANEPGFTPGLTALENALDEIFSDPKLKALIIDVRINFGGDDPYGLAVASRLATRDYLAYTKQARADPVDRNKWTPGDPSVVHPSNRPSFHGPIVELIGPLTISAGETFTQALMGRTPHILRIGENTQGVFSDVLGRKLPNGWQFGLPNEVFRTPDGKTFDEVGIPPDIEVPVFTDADVTAGKDPAIAKAMEWLGRQVAQPAGAARK